ncbi:MULTISPECIES: CvpA family protein [Weeksella]|uniref:CvpA family protein n=1 Tax=Weeksella TaxID=1013 RepID=UPI0009F2A113|nr:MULTISPECIES: CvpA family protein [Weeksella]MDK7375188.1 CvpA family protein [Weeksella virosa]SUP54935.1 Colicin V production protein [Weeksella virosa]
MNQINILDLLLGLFLVIGAIRGYSRGFIAQLVGFFGFFIALFISLKAYHGMEIFLQSVDWISESFISLLAILLTFALILLTIRIVSTLVQKSIQTIGLGFVNRLAGAVLGVVICLMISSSFMHIVSPIGSIFFPEIKKNSLLLEPLTQASEHIKILWSDHKDSLENISKNKEIIDHPSIKKR